MASTFTAKSGYKAYLTCDGDLLPVRGAITVSAKKALLDITCISDGVVPFRSYVLGLYDQATFTVPVVYDKTQDAVDEIIDHSVAGTTFTLVIKDESTGDTLVSGSAFATFEYSAAMDDVQVLNVTFTYTGTLTGYLVTGT